MDNWNRRYRICGYRNPAVLVCEIWTISEVLLLICLWYFWSVSEPPLAIANSLINISRSSRAAPGFAHCFKHPAFSSWASCLIASQTSWRQLDAEDRLHCSRSSLCFRPMASWHLASKNVPTIPLNYLDPPSDNFQAFWNCIRSCCKALTHPALFNLLLFSQSHLRTETTTLYGSGMACRAFKPMLLSNCQEVPWCVCVRVPTFLSTASAFSFDGGKMKCHTKCHITLCRVWKPVNKQ